MLVLGEGIFLSLSKIDKLYRHMCAKAVAEYEFTPNEIVVLMFLSNNAPLDTATDIVHFRGISKSLVAKSVDNLCCRGFLETQRDSADRRIVHLTLTPESQPVVERLYECRRNLNAQLTEGISVEDQLLLSLISKKMDENLNELLREDEENETI